MNQIISIILSILSILTPFFKRNKRKEEITKIQDKQQEVNFKSHVEEIVKKAESKDEKTKQDALEAVRVLVSE